jgi:hypothetical protein
MLPPGVEGALAERHNFANALAVAAYLNILLRNRDWVRLAHLAQLVNAIAPVVMTPITVDNRSEGKETAAIRLHDDTFASSARAALRGSVSTGAAKTTRPGGLEQVNIGGPTRTPVGAASGSSARASPSSLFEARMDA